MHFYFLGGANSAGVLINLSKKITENKFLSEVKFCYWSNINEMEFDEI